MVTLLILLGLAIGGGTLFVKTSPEFGGKASEADLKRYTNSKQYDGEVFVNSIPTAMDMSFSSILSTSIQFIKGVPNGKPSEEPPHLSIDSLSIAQNIDRPRFIWFGHSAFLLQIHGKNILIDPMLGDVPAPHPMLGGKRYQKSLPIEIEKLPQIDAIIISHDHYDHLDYGSIQKLKDKTKHFLLPLGVGKHFIAWGVEPEKVQEFDWWEKGNLDSLQLTFTPSRHFSGRGLKDRNKSLWGSWVIQSSSQSIYFSGDGGYGPHFKEIGERFGPFDFSFLECGQYNEKWQDIHMMPEETAQASVDLKSKVSMPIHWGSFTLALHSWTDPVERMTSKMQDLNQEYLVPMIGESVWLDNLPKERKVWW